MVVDHVLQGIAHHRPVIVKLSVPPLSVGNNRSSLNSGVIKHYVYIHKQTKLLLYSLNNVLGK